MMQIITDLEPEVIEKLKVRASSQGRTLEAEIKAIVLAAVEPAPVTKKRTLAESRQIFEAARQRYAGREFSDSAELLREDRQR